MPQHVIDFWLHLEEVDDGLIHAGQLSQACFVMRIGQHSHVKNIVGIQRNAAFEGKRFKHQRQLTAWIVD